MTSRYTLLLTKTDPELTVQDSPYHLQQTFLNQLISRCVLRLESHGNSDWAVFSLQNALGEDVHQDIGHWLDRLQGAVYRVSVAFTPSFIIIQSSVPRSTNCSTPAERARQFKNAQ